MSGMRERFSSQKGKVLKLFRLAFSSRDGEFDISSHTTANQDLSQLNTFNTQAYILGKQRMHEIETQKAMAIVVSRHERWKAGGPV
jgi:hypothetical protein